MSKKSIKIHFETGDVGHDVRGIGVHTTELAKRLKPHITTKKEDADIIHITSFKPFEKNTIPFFNVKGKKIVLTIHDLIPLIYPKHYPPGMKGRINFWINKYKVKNNVDGIITISKTSKKDICRFLKIDPKKVHVVYLAPKKAYKKGKASVQKKYNLPKQFVLYVGDVNYNKNIPNLVKACEIAKLPLIIVGKHAKEIEKMDLIHPETAHLKNIDFSKVLRPGFVNDEDLNIIYSLANVYVQPSLYEGFGLPALEAVAARIPLVATKTQALVEILGTDIRYVDPQDPKDMAKGILNPNKNVKFIKNYFWEKTAKETLYVYAKI